MVTFPSERPKFRPDKEQPKIPDQPELSKKEVHFPIPYDETFPKKEGLSNKHLISLLKELHPSNLEQLQTFLEEDVNTLQNHIENIAKLNPTMNLEEFIVANGDQMIKNLLVILKRNPEEKGKPEEIKETNQDAFQIPFLEGLEALATQASSYAHFSDLLGLRSVQGSSSQVMSGMELGIIFANFLSKGGILIAVSMLITEAKKNVDILKLSCKEANEEDQTQIKKDIELLETWIDKQTTLLKNYAATSAISSLLAVPKVSSGILNLLNMATTIAGTVMESLVAGISLVTSAWEWHNASNQIKDQQVWTSLFKNTRDFQTVIEEQEKIFHSRLEKNLPQLDKQLQSINNILNNPELSSEEAINQALTELDNKKIKIEELESATTIDEFSKLIDQPDIKEKMNKQMVQHKEELSVSLRQALKIFILKKASIDKGFLQLKLNKAKGIFTVTALMTAITITLKVLIAVGVIVATGAMMATGYGILAATLIGAIVGLCYLYYKKPNIFKTFIQGVQAKLVFKNLALSIQDLRKRSLELEASRVSRSIHLHQMSLTKIDELLKQKDQIFLQILPSQMQESLSAKQNLTQEEIREYLEEHQETLKTLLDKEMEKYLVIGQKLDQLNHSIDKLDKQVDELKTRIREAGWKDYLSLKQKTKSQESEAIVLVDYLLRDESLEEDKQTAFLLKQMQIDMSAIRKLSEREGKDLLKELETAIKSFFAMDDAQAMLQIYKASQ